MSIGRSAGPRVIATGQLTSVRELPPAKKTGEVWGIEATLRDEDGASVFVKFRVPRQEADAEALSNRVGEVVALWARANTGARGEELWFDREVTADDLDTIASAFPAKV